MNLDNFKHAGREITHRDDNSFLERTLAGDQFKELILTPCGELFINPGKTIEAEDFWLYFKPDMYMEGALYANCNGEFRTWGTTIPHAQSFKLLKNQTAISLLSDGIQLFSKRAGIPVGSTLIAFFHYRQKVVLIIAGDAFNRRSRTLITDESETNNSFFFQEFVLILNQYDPNMAVQLVTSQEVKSVAYITTSLTQ